MWYLPSQGSVASGSNKFERNSDVIPVPARWQQQLVPFLNLPGSSLNCINFELNKNTWNTLFGYSAAPLLPEHVHNHLLVSLNFRVCFLARYNNIVNSSSQYQSVIHQESSDLSNTSPPDPLLQPSISGTDLDKFRKAQMGHCDINGDGKIQKNELAL
ncbi:hypothetical protein F7725_025537 [Dissostichus mawsoni]|uniref:EF-hand domain-containing protein n=1 Tax=Dissostichus mawsoni TaxID=36200 RepID=A0A7J5XBW9_DISMA|nr:hypothetical protein F7725_025537 [Dissostichus mawsoni]